MSFHAKVSDAYLKIAEEHPDRFVVVDATGTPAAVHARVIDALGRLLAGRTWIARGRRDGRGRGGGGVRRGFGG